MEPAKDEVNLQLTSLDLSSIYPALPDSPDASLAHYLNDQSDANQDEEQDDDFKMLSRPSHLGEFHSFFQ